jgi:spore coat protein U-like protein
MRSVVGAAGRAVLAAIALSAAVGAQSRSTPNANAANKTCILSGASVMSFGTYDPMTDIPLDVQGRVTFRCGSKNLESRLSRAAQIPKLAALKGKLVVQISLSAGNAGQYQRYLTAGGDKLRYNLFLDPERTTIWGDGTNGSAVYSAQAQPNGKDVIVPVFGRIFADQDVEAGFYTDQIIVTLDF